MNNKLTIYTYTPDRLNEFKEEKKENDYITTPLLIFNNNKSCKIPNDSNIYVDISHYYKSFQEDPLQVEKLIYEVQKNPYYHVIINYNLLTRFKADFGQYIHAIYPINNIYTEENEKNYDFCSLDIEQINLLEKELNDKLYGHENIKKELLKKIRSYNVLYNIGEIKIMSLFICGESGVGKTELAKIIHNTLYSHSKIIKINLGNYKSQGSLNSLIGSPKGYFGSERGGELSNKIQNSDSKIILIDEFEKADIDIFNFFYELLEDGKFTDLNENEFNLNGYLIVFTSNLNENNYKEIIPSPLLSRFTMKVLFEPIDYSIKKKYINDKSEKMIKLYNEKYNDTLNYEEVISRIDESCIKNISNFRYLNQLIQNSLISYVDNK